MERPGQVISRAELQRLLWGDATFGDFEQGLNSAVNKLRQALGDSADQARYVETLPGRGYRFIGPLQRPSARPVLAIAAQAPARTEAGRPRQAGSWLPWVAGMALAVVGIGGYWLGSRRAEPVEVLKPARFTVTPPAGFALEGAASRQSFALSPDGTRLAFTAMNSTGALHAFLRDLSSLEPRLVPESEGSHTLFWHPDGRSLLLTVRGKLRRAPLDGDTQGVLCDSPSFVLSGAALTPDMLLIGGYRASYTVSPSGGTPHLVQAVYPWPQALPDGEHLLYIRWDSQAGRHRARVARFGDPGSARDLIETDSRVMYTASVADPGAGHLLFVRAGNLLAQPFDPRSLRITGQAAPVVSKVYSFFPTGAADFSVSDRGVLAYQSYVSRSQLVWVDRKDRQVATIGPANINVKSARLSPDGRRLATAIYDVERGAQDLWVFDTKTGAGRRLTLEPGLRDAPLWSPDSRSLAYLHAAGGRLPRIYVRGLGEKDAEEALPAADFQLPTDWSSDGRFIAFVNTGVPRYANETQSDAWVVDLARDRKLVPLLNTPFHESNVAFSPDGKWLAFTSNESGRTEVYVQAFEATDPPRVAGERFLASRSGALAVRWRRDGKELFYLAYDGRVHAVPVRLSPKPEFGPSAPLFTVSTEARAAIHSIVGFDVSADGQRFVIPAVTSPGGPSLVVVQNWEAAFSRKP